MTKTHSRPIEAQGCSTMILSRDLYVAILTDAASGAVSRPLPSDARLKTDITPVGTSPAGHAIYTYRYKGHPDTFRGVMAQEVLKATPEAVVTTDAGYLAVDYSQIDVDFRVIN